MNTQKQSIQKMLVLALLLSVALIAGLVERLIPVPVGIPGIKLGFGNVVILAALYLFPLSDVALLAVLKTTVTAFFGGSALSFLYSLIGSLFSLAAMKLTICSGGEHVSPVGVSIVGGVSHNIGQLAAASVMMQSPLVWTYLPLLLLAGAAAGTLTGLIVLRVIPLLTHYLSVAQKP